MTEHLSSAQVVNYRLRKLAPAELLGMDDHLAECAECRRLIESTLNNDAIGLYAALAAEAAAGPHLTFDQTAAYVDGLLTGEERRMIEDHLASCARCAPLTDDLRAFRNEIAPDLGREYRPREMARRMAQEAAESAPQAGRWDRIAAALLAFFPKIPFWIYAALVLSLSAAAVWIAISRRTPPQVAHTSPTPQPSLSSANFASPTPEIANVIVRLNDGGASLALDAQGRLTGADQWPSEYRRMAADALSNQSAPKSPLLAGLSRPGNPLMRGHDEGRSFAVIEPAGKVILTDRPSFKWTRLEGANGYVVEIYDAQFNLVSSSPTLTDDGWMAPQLARGRVYSWQVKAISGGQEFIAPGPAAPQAKFRILDQAAADEIAHARRDYASSHLLLGLLYARAGLLAEAEQEFRALQKANPDSGAARKLTASVSNPRR
ncbi:MAG: zf-HC2 domain-containing protein [Blastocatellia bacterium]|nr:zf-HC2 domain-containing protein [Blastocatellia bacterium]